MTKTKASLLDAFLGEFVIMFLQNVDTTVDTEEGTATIPLALEGIVYDYDERFVLIGTEDKSAYSLVNLNCICKIDTVNEAEEHKKDNPKNFN